MSDLVINTKKYHVLAPMGRFQLESIYLTLRFLCTFSPDWLGHNYNHNYSASSILSGGDNVLLELMWVEDSKYSPCSSKIDLTH